MEGQLYLVYIDEGDGTAMHRDFDAFEMAEGVFLVRSEQTRSRLYHVIKRRVVPDRLLVAALSDAPKFKGMAPGALKWLQASGV